MAGTACALLSVQAPATWSIVAVNRATGEVAIASATCIENLPLRAFLAVVVVGKGAGAAQAAVNPTGQNRLEIWNGLHAGWSPQQILDHLENTVPTHQSHQYGLASFAGPAVSFTGSSNGSAALSVAGEDATEQ